MTTSSTVSILMFSLYLHYNIPKSMSDLCGSAACGCCRCCCTFIFTSGLTAFFIWLSLRTSNSKCSLQDIYIPALNQTANSTLTNHNITLNLKFKNVMKDKSVRYDDLNLTLLYYSKNNSQTVGNKIMKGFKQGHSGKAQKQETVEAFGVPWDEAEDAAKNKSAVFGVSLSTKVKFKIMFWYTKKHHWRFEANVTVDDTGKRSDGGVPRPRWWCPVAGFLVILYFTDLMF